ncbi:MAG TPA: hypothetical protein VMT30_03500 [Candidatus Saccharimonadia bacterium]|nr:hypothetical protein [Candidatus Saccharimonadia bacterium]
MPLNGTSKPFTRAFARATAEDVATAVQHAEQMIEERSATVTEVVFLPPPGNIGANYVAYVRYRAEQEIDFVGQPVAATAAPDPALAWQTPDDGAGFALIGRVVGPLPELGRPDSRAT